MKINSMGSAPKDGTPILIKDDGFDVGFVVAKWFDGGWDTGFGSEIDGATIYATDPEGWFALPSA